MDEAALRELANGPLVRRLQISEARPDGLKQCTREMFALVMVSRDQYLRSIIFHFICLPLLLFTLQLIRLGKITEQDVRATFGAFHKLDLDHDGRLTSKEIILSAVEEERKRGTRIKEDVNKSVISRSPEKRSIFFSSTPSSQINDTPDQRQIENTTLEERKYLLQRTVLSQPNNKLIAYGSSDGGDDIEAGNAYDQI